MDFASKKRVNTLVHVKYGVRHIALDRNKGKIEKEQGGGGRVIIQSASSHHSQGLGASFDAN